MSLNPVNVTRRAHTQLKSWLKAVEIPFEDFQSHILITKSDQNKISLCFDNTPITGERILIDTDKLVNKKIQNSLDFFTDLQKQLGYQPKLPVDRGTIPDVKTSDFDLTALRHFELRKCPNPPAKKLNYYKPVISMAVNKFYRYNLKNLSKIGIEFEDLMTYAQMWTVNFIGLYELPVRGDNQNNKLLMEFLKQRFIDFHRRLSVRLQTLPSQESNMMGTEIFDYYKYLEEETENVAKPLDKITASKLLEQKLQTLDHDRMVELLLESAKNEHSDFEVRTEASKQLHAHSLKCFKCADLELPNVGGGDLTAYSNRPIVDQNGVVYESPKEAAKALGVFASNIRSVLNGKYKQTGGFAFKYLTQSTNEAGLETTAELH